jgi:cytochrome c553
MVFTKSIIVFVIGVVLIAIPFAYAGDNPEEVKRRVGIGNPVAGKDKAAQCTGCHGKDGNNSATSIPKLAGQYADYIQRQIFNYQEGTRRGPNMTKISETLSNRQNLADIAAYFASQNQMTGTPSKNEEGEKLYIDKGCLDCHGESGKGKPHYNAIFPVIGGQHKESIVKEMKDFKTGARATDISEIMSLLTLQMTDAEIEAVADYLSSL